MNPELFEKVKAANAVLIALPKTARRDSIAAALGLYLALIQEGKSVHVCSEADVAQGTGLAGLDAVKRTLNLGGNVLKVSFPYNEGAIDKVTYNITDDKFNLLVEPRQGEKPLSADAVQYTYTGGSVDVIITIDTPALEQLGNAYLDNPDIFAQDKIVNIDRRFDNKQYGAINVVEKQASSTSELVCQLLAGMRIQMNQDTATNLYAGIVAATNNFTSFSTNAQTFEAASLLLKAGARKMAAPRPQQQAAPMPMPMRGPMFGGGMPPMMPQQPAGSMPFDDFDDDFDDPMDMPMPAPMREPVMPLQPQAPVPPPASAPTSTPAPMPAPQQDKPQDKQPPMDWLKPKIFKSSDVVK